MRLDVDNFGGEVVVKAWNQNSVRVQATHSSRDRIDVEVGASTVSVKAESRRGIAQMVEYQISAPAWMNLNLHGVSTDIEVDGAQGAVTAETVNGEVKCRGGSGQVSLKSVQGAVMLQNAKGHIDVYSVSEGLTLENVSGDISAETVSGDISLEGIESASVEVSTVSGDVTYEGSIKDGALSLRHAQRRRHRRDPGADQRDRIGRDVQRRLRLELPCERHEHDQASLQLHARVRQRPARARDVQRRHPAAPARPAARQAPRRAGGPLTMRAISLATLALLAGVVPPARAQGEFHWSGRLASGKRLEIKGVNGDIHAVGVTSGA